VLWILKLQIAALRAGCVVMYFAIGSHRSMAIKMDDRIRLSKSSRFAELLGQASKVGGRKTSNSISSVIVNLAQNSTATDRYSTSAAPRGRAITIKTVDRYIGETLHLRLLLL